MDSNLKKAIFLDRDGVINVERSYICQPEDFELYPFTFEAIKKINDAGYLAVVVSNQSAIARNMCTVEQVDKVHEKLRKELDSSGAYIDAIYYCPHLPNLHLKTGNPLYLKECDCRKPKTGLFEMAVKDFFINPKESWMVGDSNRDIVAGKNFGCKTIGVLTGHGKKGFSEEPDYISDNLLEAVKLILSQP